MAIVSIIISNRAFDIANLILKNMFDVLANTNIGFSYGCSLTRMFEFYHVELDDCDKVEVMKFLDDKRLNHFDLFVNENGTLYQISPETPSGPSMVMPFQVNQISIT